MGGSQVRSSRFTIRHDRLSSKALPLGVKA
jgi:hypothetical protein